jgi:hypothetical protein
MNGTAGICGGPLGPNPKFGGTLPKNYLPEFQFSFGATSVQISSPSTHRHLEKLSHIF